MENWKKKRGTEKSYFTLFMLHLLQAFKALTGKTFFVPTLQIQCKLRLYVVIRIKMGRF